VYIQKRRNKLVTDFERQDEMINKVLVAYTTMSGSTAEVAKTVGETVAKDEIRADVLPLEGVSSLTGYDAVIIGAPMIMGWHRSALRFLRKHQGELERIPLAIFALAMSLTSTDEMSVDQMPVHVDEKLAKPPIKPGHPNFRERYASLNHYFSSILKAAGAARPVSLAIFGGRLDYFRLKLPAKMFVMLIVQAQPGDRRNWSTIRSWAASLPDLFKNSTPAGKD
jgi:menaquinone-dependent protoporphyrinogen IX oxidase